MNPADAPTVAIADEDGCFECGRRYAEEPPCTGCMGRLADEARAVFGNPNVLEVLMGRATVARDWGEVCILCARVVSDVELGRNVLTTDGSRGFAHEECIWRPEMPRGGYECIHGLVPASTCTWCNGKGSPIFAKSRAFRARRPGVCFECDGAFARGDLIQKASSRKGLGWMHATHLRT